MKKLPTKLYHVSLDLAHSGVFAPRVPESRMESEDAVTARICVADSVDGCLTASPFGAHYLSESLLETDDCVKIFVIDTEKLGLTSSDVLFPGDLYQSGQVDDAYLSGEHWILTGFTVPPEDQLIVRITEVDDTDWKPFISFDVRSTLIRQGVDFADSDELDKAYYSLLREEMPSLCTIKDVEYVTL